MVRLGVDTVDEHARLFTGRRLGLVMNHASLDSRLVPTADRLRALPGVQLERLFAPEHGLYGVLQDGEEDRDSIDPASGLPVVALYGPRRMPEPAHFADLDAVVFDLPDVGVRAYTYLATLLQLCTAAAAAGCQMIVLDRPNPAGGTAEGGGIDPGRSSFVAPMDVPLRHGLTLGELARLHCAGAGLPIPDIVPCTRWRREPVAADARWISPSPNLPSPLAALVYAGMVLIEGTGLSEGRGTTRPFTLVGAPALDGRALARHLAALDLPGVKLWPMAFRPNASKHAGRVCYGIEMHVDDRRSFRALPLVLEIIAWVRDHQPDQLSLNPAMALLSGGDSLGAWCATRDARPADLLAGWTDFQRAFADRARPYLLYPEAA